jgi:hypothetical protein
LIDTGDLPELTHPRVLENSRDNAPPIDRAWLVHPAKREETCLVFLFQRDRVLFQRDRVLFQRDRVLFQRDRAEVRAKTIRLLSDDRHGTERVQ